MSNKFKVQLSDYLAGLNAQLGETSRFDEREKLYKSGYRGDVESLFQTYTDKYLGLSKAHGDVVRASGGLTTGRDETDFSRVGKSLREQYGSSLESLNNAFHEKLIGVTQERSNFVSNIGTAMYSALSSYKSATGRTYDASLGNYTDPKMIQDNINTLLGNTPPATPPQTPKPEQDENQENPYGY